MYNKICLIIENTIAYSNFGYAVLSAGTPVILRSVIKDAETREEVASIVDSNGNEYKMLEADLIALDKEEIKLLLDDSIPQNCEKYKKRAGRLRSLPFWFLAIFGTPLLTLNLFNVSAPLLISSLFSLLFLTSFGSAFSYIKNERKGKYPISEDYFLSYEENKEKLKTLIQRKEEKEEAEEEYADLGVYEEESGKEKA